MKDKFIGLGGAIFTVGLVAIPALVAFYYVVFPILCFVAKGCNIWGPTW